MLLAGIGGILGAIARYWLGQWIASTAAARFPVGTWVINISGSFLLGLLVALHSQGAVPGWTWLFFGTGFLGAYTTFSTFGYETIRLLQEKEAGMATAYVLASVLLGVLFAWLGGMAGGTWKF